MKKAMLVFINAARRARWLLLVALIMGVGLCAAFGAMANLSGTQYGAIPVGFIAHESNATAEDLLFYLRQDLSMEVTVSDDIELLNTELVERHISAIVEVPAGFESALLKGEPVPLLVSFLDDYANAAFVKGYLESYTASIAMLAAGAQKSTDMFHQMLADAQQGSVPFSTTENQGIALDDMKQQEAFKSILGFYMMIAFLLGFLVAFQVFDDRQSGVFQRVRVSNLRSIQYIAGTCMLGVASAVCLICPFFVYLLVTRPSVGMGLVPAAVLCLLYALFAVGVSLFVSLYLSSKNAITAAIIATSTITCLVGGAYFPINTSPVFLQKLARATPQFWFIKAVDTLQENPQGSWGLYALVICLFALLFYILSGARFAEGAGKQSTAGM